MKKKAIPLVINDAKEIELLKKKNFQFSLFVVVVCVALSSMVLTFFLLLYGDTHVTCTG